MAHLARAAVERPPLSEADASARGAQIDRQLIAERRLRGAELALGGARRELERAREQLSRLAERVGALERELERARAEPERLRELLRASERLRRQAEQAAEAEHRERKRLERLLSSARHQPPGERDGELERRADALAQRVLELERQLRERTRELDELEHLLAVARRARDRAQAAALRAIGGALATPFASARAMLAAEGQLARRALRERDPPGRSPASAPRAPASAAQTPFGAALSAERALAAALSAGVRPAVGARGSAPAAAEVDERAGHGDGRSRAEHQRDDGVDGALVALAEELDALAELARHEREERRRAQDRVAELERELQRARRAGDRALSVTEALAEELRALGAGAVAPESEAHARPSGEPPPGGPPPGGPGASIAAPPRPAATLPEDPAGRVEPELLSAALDRLRNGACAAAQQPPEAVEDPAREQYAAGGGDRAICSVEDQRRAQDAAGGGVEAISGGSAKAVGGEATPPTATGPWLRRAFRRLARRDPTAAGELALALLPLARAPRGQPIAFDLVLGDGQCLQVSASDTAGEVRVAAGPRPLERVDARVCGDAAALGRLVGAGALARMLGRGPQPRVQGSRRVLRTLRALADVRVRLGELPQLGVQMPAELVLRLVAAMLTRQITGGSALTIAHREPDGSQAAFLSVRDRERPQAGELTPGVMSSLTVWCEARALPALLDGAVDPRALGARVEGAVDNLQRLRSWIEHAQRG